MSHPSHGAIVIVGSGPGIGVHVVTKFASNGFKNVVLLARNKTRLEEEANAVRSAAGQDVKVHTVSTDLADGQSVEAGLKQIDQALGDVPLEAVLFNPARVGPSTFFEFAPEEFEQDLKLIVVGLYRVAQWALPKLLHLHSLNLPSSKPFFLTTSGLLYREPFSHLFSLSAAKAAQYNLMQSLWQEFGPKGVHCAVLPIGGFVSKEAEVCSPETIAETAWMLYQQKRGTWQFKAELEDQEYAEGVRKQWREMRGL